MNFLLQTVNGKIIHDFVFELDRSLEYQKWKGEEVNVLYSELEDLKTIDNYVPVGTIEFVKKFNNNTLPSPINIPSCYLMNPKITMYPVVEGNPKDLVTKDNTEYFVKDSSIIKSPLNGFYTDIKNFNSDKVQIREKIQNIESEWRIFVYRGEILGCQYYLGDPLCFPSAEFIKNCVKNYINCPEAYTLDVFITDNFKTYLLEVHDFYSCGLYGFSDYNKLPFMFIRTWNKIKQI